VFVVAPGCFLPREQEVGARWRTTARRTSGAVRSCGAAIPVVGHRRAAAALRSSAACCARTSSRASRPRHLPRRAHHVRGTWRAALSGTTLGLRCDPRAEGIRLPAAVILWLSVTDQSRLAVPRSRPCSRRVAAASTVSSSQPAVAVVGARRTSVRRRVVLAQSLSCADPSRLCSPPAPARRGRRVRLGFFLARVRHPVPGRAGGAAPSCASRGSGRARVQATRAGWCSSSSASG
jgi:hypothetical protein